MPIPVPTTRPKLSESALLNRIRVYDLDRAENPVVVVGIRGYYLNSMGAPAKNDRGIYDDALFIHTPSAIAAFNGNTDPSKMRKGKGTRDGERGMASLKPGAWKVHRFDKHNGKYLALCQREGPVTVLRDGISSDYEHTGADFGINIHRGGYNTTSSLGCQTVHPDQWPTFINLAMSEARRYFGVRWNRMVIPYVLLEEAPSPP